MNVHLMHPDADWEAAKNLPAHTADVSRDLGLDVIWEDMARGDAFLRGTAQSAMLASATDATVIGFRQAILTDALHNPALLRELYALADEAIESERRVWGAGIGRRPEGILHRGLEVQRRFLPFLRRLRDTLAGVQALRSAGMLEFAARTAADLDESRLARVEALLDAMEFKQGVFVSAGLGQDQRGTAYRLHWPEAPSANWAQRLWRRLHGELPETLIHTVDDRDTAGLQALAELQDQGIVPPATAVAQATAGLLAFFRQLRQESGFYCACLNLHDALRERGLPFCFPTPQPGSAALAVATGLYDLALGLRQPGPIIGNGVNAGSRTLIVITGANRAGKTTFLRALGQAQVMMQCGMFVPGSSFHADLRSQVFTHFKRMEDPRMVSGKLDEELDRMSRLIDAMTPNSFLLCNESFASTNEREGAEIARQVLTALAESGIRVAFVTHLHEFVQDLWDTARPSAAFLQPELDADGKPTFRLVAGIPEAAGHADQLFRRIWGERRA